jgi:hypothetical protein
MSLALVEILEARRLLSVAPALQSHPPPNILNAIYVGSYIARSGVTGTLSIDITSENKRGKISGTIGIDVLGTPLTFRISGSVNSKWDFSWHGSTGHKSLSATGALNSNLTIMSGKFKYAAKHGSSTGTFEATEVEL